MPKASTHPAHPPPPPLASTARLQALQMLGLSPGNVQASIAWLSSLTSLEKLILDYDAAGARVVRVFLGGKP